MKQHKSSKCDVCATPYFERNNYFYGKQFTVRDLVQEQSYFNEKRHLINRMVLGWGVVCGLDVKWVPEHREFIIGTGMALDCCGREIIVCDEHHEVFKDYDEQCRCAKEQPEYEGKFVLCLEYDDCCTEPVELPAIGVCNDEDRTEFNRVRDGFKLTIRKWEDACPKQPYDHITCLNRFKHDVGGGEKQTGGTDGRKCETETMHHYLCSEIKKDCPECNRCDCVVLATINVKAGKPEPHEEEKGYAQQKGNKGYEQGGHEHHQPTLEVNIDTCTDRRFVYNNSLLYDLIHCHHGDLPHIVDFSWRKHTYPTREVGIGTFLQMMKDGLTVYFDQEMEPESLNSHTFIVSYIRRDTGTGAYVENRIPVMEIKSGKVGDCYTATFVATKRWIDKELDAEDTELRAGHPNIEPGVNVEITLRGSRIWSMKKKGLDGDFLADKLPTGNGTQGGDFVDWFRVMPIDEKKDQKKYTDF